MRPDLEAAAAAGGAAILGVTRLGGAGEGMSGHGAVAGFLKTLPIEWSTVRVKAVDLADDAEVDAAGT